MRRKNLADNLAIKAMTLDADVAHALAHRLTGLDSKIVQQFDDVDMNALARIVESFTTPGQSTPTAAPG